MAGLRTIRGPRALGIEPSVRRLAPAAALSLSPPGTEDREERITRITSFYMRGLLGGRFEAAELGDSLIVWERPVWDRDVTGIDCAAVRILGGPECGPLLDLWLDRARNDGIEYAVARVPGTDEAAPSERALGSSGFERIESILWMHSASPEIAAGPPPAGVEVFEAGRKDSADLSGIASRSFAFDRFHSEPVFGRETADRVHAVWAAGLVERPGVTVLAARFGGVTAGYVALVAEGFLPHGAGLIEMIAVEPGSRRRGVGTALLAAAAGRFHESGMSSVFLCTQEHNVSAVALYERCGFETYGRSATWRSDLRANPR